jgi:fucose 4-O-acetylase-like acetyltransferase
MRERRLNLQLAAAGVVVAGGALGSTLLPSPYPNSYFWTTSPAYFCLRVGLVTTGIAAAYGWTALFVTGRRWSPVVQLGKTSLFIYWIHVEMVYGLASRPLHHALSLPQAAVAYVLFSAFMLVCSVAKERFGGWYRPARAAAAAV